MRAFDGSAGFQPALCWKLFLLSLFLLVWSNPAEAQNRITCESRDGRPAFCEADTRGGVRLVRQRSDAACREGDTWGFDRRGIWVDRGCRAEFELRSGSSGGAEVITCSSENRRRHFCPADTRGGVRLVRQFSDAACRQGSTWGYDANGIWVDRGCRAEFEVRSGWRWPGSGTTFPGTGGGGIGSQTLRCESRDQRRRTCPVDLTNATVRVGRQLSNNACIQGRTWGHDARGIWVDRGCRADFEISFRDTRRGDRRDDRRGRDDRRDDRRDRDDDWYGRRGRAATSAERACADEVARRLNVPARSVAAEDTTQRTTGTQLIEWRAGNREGYCRVNPQNRVIQFKVD